MKTIFRFNLFLLLITILYSCNDFLDREPISQITPDEYFNSETNANSAVIGMYRTMMGPFSYGQSIVIVPEFSAGHVTHASLYPEYENFRTNTVQVNNPWINNIWQATYATINAANNIITRVPEMPANSITDEKRQQFIGEAKFVRALNYFLLVRAFGNIPLKTNATSEEEDLDIPQTPTNEVYQQIITDLQDAAGSLPETYTDEATTKGRATALAAKGLLAKVSLYYGSINNDYTQAASLAEEIINKQTFELVSDFASIWTNENTRESLFELQFDDQVTNPLAAVSNDNASMLFYVRGTTVYDTYTANDKRRDFTVKSGSRGRYYIGKFPKNNPASQNLPVLRIAEIYLIHAEASARVNSSVSPAAYASYKAVRDRAGLTTPPAASFTNLDAFLTAVQKEKELELMFEGETWFDFCRTGLALTDMMVNPDPNYFLYPIPSGQIVLSDGKLTQNPGY